MFKWMQQLFSPPASQPAPSAQPGSATAEAPPPAPPPRPAAGTAPSGFGPSFDQRDDLNTVYHNWLFGTESDSALDLTAAETQVLDAVSAIVKSQQSGAALVRRMPGLIPQLLQSLRTDNFSGAQLSRTISSDLVLVAAVIRLANSSSLSYGTTITSVEHAVMLIGTEGLRHLITSVAFRPIIDMHSGHYTRALAPRIWDQCERCAVANRMLAEEMGIDPFEAFLAGLVQYVGLIVTLRIMDQADKDGTQLGSAMFCASLLRDARTLSCSIGREWHFPDTVVQAIAEQAGARKGVQVSPMGQLLAQSDYLAKVRILAEHGQADSTDPALFRGLSASAQACYHKLHAIPDELPDVAAAPLAQQ
ncbi:HDOD domain-containing protein [Massilia sp. PAMC28688]|uniref:HDOD domain-containing protein n=1 Tax=Massilia sp. PAMC28688 TaxID=2861283 RepID=UPI001C627BC9|nr:HDOD domain-containing protein [Massilia sp. PAMC28688]QYF92456.1 HDOD domain-containing protein [Massilia sp. PAMC28688]